MSTPIKNTLFRFVTLRAPEQLADEARRISFIQHPNPELSHFEPLMSADHESQEEWKDDAIALAGSLTPVLDAASLKDISPDLLAFAKWLTRNKAQVVSSGSTANYMGGTLPSMLGQSDLVTLWDNLFYQLLTHQSPSLRDLILQVLIANNYIFLAPEGLCQRKKAPAAKVVIPKTFFYHEPVKAGGGTTTTVYTRQLEQDLKKVLAADTIERITAAIDEVKRAAGIYERAKNTSLAEARQEYDEDLAVVVKSNTVFDSGLGEYKITPFEYPAFAFTPEPQMTPTFLEQHLSEETMFLLDETGLASSDSFEAVIEGLGKLLNEQHRILFSNKKVSRQMVGIGRIILPGDFDIQLPNQQYAFVMKLIPAVAGMYRVYVAINMGYANADVVHADYKAVFAGPSEVPGQDFSEYPEGNTLVLVLFPGGITLPQGTATFPLQGTITTADGTVLSFNTTLSLTQDASGRMTTGNGDAADESDAAFVPKGFGIRRLGVADYRKVEQTTCCYVPGEVSHIENIMAGEYKERSTRRLRRSEDTTTVETQTERETLTDTTSADRYEMQQEVSEVLNKDTSFGINSSVSFSVGPFLASLGSNFSTSTSQQQSNSQAVSFAKDVTERAMDRVVQKVREERIRKVIEEFEEQNKHGFDNKTGTKHISGVYRWVDKIYKNQVYNYGKRLMYEFMIPQPSAFHTEMLKNIGDVVNGVELKKPLDPREAGLKDYRNITEESYAHWAAVYNAAPVPVPEETRSVGKSFKIEAKPGNIANDEVYHVRYVGQNGEVELPEGYSCSQVSILGNLMFHPSGLEYAKLVVQAGDSAAIFRYTYSGGKTASVDAGNPYHAAYDADGLRTPQVLYFSRPVSGRLPVSCNGYDIEYGTYTVMAVCTRTQALYDQWRIEAFNSIINAYEERRAQYNEAISSLESKKVNPQFYRQIENTILRKNCLHYLLPQNYLGRNLVTPDAEPDITEELDRYAARVKFLEQAFEWDLIGYTFYPFYWGNKAKWDVLYGQEVDDALFRSFLQSGMARVVVTVRPGFEETVMHYMATGQVWNGGEIPVLGDDLYLSFVEELKNPTFYVEETWETRVPTALTILQAGDVVLEAGALPCCEGHLSEFGQPSVGEPLDPIDPDPSSPPPDLPSQPA
jgi:hypothetical protein